MRSVLFSSGVGALISIARRGEVLALHPVSLRLAPVVTLAAASQQKAQPNQLLEPDA